MMSLSLSPCFPHLLACLLLPCLLACLLACLLDAYLLLVCLLACLLACWLACCLLAFFFLSCCLLACMLACLLACFLVACMIKTGGRKIYFSAAVTRRLYDARRSETSMPFHLSCMYPHEYHTRQFAYSFFDACILWLHGLLYSSDVDTTKPQH